MDEKRKLERYELNAPTILTVERGERAGEKLQLSTRDISAAGAYLITPASLVPGTDVQLEILLTVERLHEVVGEGDLITVNVGGTVIRSELKGMAVAFRDSYEIRTYRQDSPFSRAGK